MFSLIMGLAFNDPLGGKTWWIVFGLPLIFIVVQSFFLLFVYPYETPKYLFSNGQDLRGRMLLERIYKPQYVDNVIKEIKINLGQQVVDSSA